MWTITFALLTLVSWISYVSSVPSLKVDFAPNAKAAKLGIRGADVIRVLGTHYKMAKAFLGSSEAPGIPGNLLVSTEEDPPAFFINGGQLYQVNNISSVLYVNLVNITDKEPWRSQVREGEVPLPQVRMQLSLKKEGIQGEWGWVNNILLFRMRGSSENSMGVWWMCNDRDGSPNTKIYMNLRMYNKHERGPRGCSSMTLHSFGDEMNMLIQ